MALTLERIAHHLLPPVAPGRALADGEWRTLRAAAVVLLPDEMPGIDPDRVADNVERFIACGRSRMAWRIRLLLNALEVMPVPSHGARFTRLSLEAQTEIVTQKMMQGPALWRLCGRVRLLVTMGAYGDARAEAPIGFVPVPLRARYRRRSQRPREQHVELNASP